MYTYVSTVFYQKGTQKLLMLASGERRERVGGTQSPFPILSEFVDPVHTSLLKKD